MYTNKVKNPDFSEDFGDNAKLLEERLSQVDWRKLGRYYGVGLLVVLVTIFLLITTVRFALWVG